LPHIKDNKLTEIENNLTPERVIDINTEFFLLLLKQTQRYSKEGFNKFLKFLTEHIFFEITAKKNSITIFF
jgi:hypothetical protein